MKRLLTAIPVLLIALLSFLPDAGAIAIFSAQGSAVADLTPTVNAFRTALGSPNNGNAAGPLAGGRREINWDGGGSTATSPGGTPFNVFLNRGGQFTTPGTGFIQAPASGGTDGGLATAFSNATYGTTFDTAFSPVRFFVPVGSNITEALFSIPGSGGLTRAGVQGFGVVFSDVDLVGSTRIELYDFSDDLFATVDVTPLPGDGNLSFLGLLGEPGDPQIVRARIFSGNTALGPNDNPGGGVDIVAMDDFLFSEPKLIPYPAALVLLLAGGLAAAAARRGLKRSA